jgi:ABC-type transporter Mla MlaB component
MVCAHPWHGAEVSAQVRFNATDRKGEHPVNDSFSLELSGELGLRGIEKLKSDIMAALEAHDAVALETSLVESADASAIQLLLAAQKESR